MNDLDREKWTRHREKMQRAAAMLLEVLAELPATCDAFGELTTSLKHIALADRDTPDYGRDPSLRR